MSEERARLLAQLEQAYEQGILDESSYRTLRAAAGAESGASAAATMAGTGALAQGDGATAAGAGGVAVGGDVHGNIYTGPPPQDAAQALAIYRRIVAQSTGNLPLRGVDVGASDPTADQNPLGLANVYVSLDTTTQVELTEKANLRRPSQEPAAFRDREKRPLTAQEAVVANRHLVLLGDPGGGKSTFLNHLAHCLAMHGLEPDGHWLDHLVNWPKAEAASLPVVVILRDFARQLPVKLPPAEPRHLWDFIVARLEAQNLALVAESLENLLDKGRAFVLLDGLDEVPSVAQRLFVRDAVTAFVERYRASRFLVTCRVLSYQPPASPEGPDLRLAQLPTFELARLDADKIDAFICGWYDALARLRVVRPEDKDGLVQQLTEAVRRADLWRLAPNPLLLTVMALVHTHKGRLPDARALLYEETVDILLWRWEQVKVASAGSHPRLRQLLLEANRTEVDLKRVLWRLAFEAHAGVGEGEEDLADIGELKLEKALAALKGDDRNWATKLVETMKLRAGLLLEREPEVFTFPHRTFQEYLAGAHLAAFEGFSRQACKLAAQGPLWRETILLAVGKLVYLSGDTDKPLALVGELCPSRGEDDEASWRNCWLAGDVLLEAGINRVSDAALGRDLLERVQARLVELIAGGKLAARERALAGATLGRLGDPRFREDAWFLPDEPLLGFVQSPEGTFCMGTLPEEVTALVGGAPDLKWLFESEGPQHEVTLASYYLARYPVTVAQFRAFVEASGYTPGDARSLQSVPNHPVVNVSWHDARACCDWLTEMLTLWDRTPEPLGALLRDGGWRITLPSEAQWEKAARGTDGRDYPWNADANPERANYGDTGIEATSAVGCFPGGTSANGCEEMSGNVWEWTRSLWGEDWTKPDFRYPYVADDGREDLDASDEVLRVLRGGAFDLNPQDVRCAARDRYFPFYGLYHFGFRVVLSPFRSER